MVNGLNNLLIMQPARIQPREQRIPADRFYARHVEHLGCWPTWSGFELEFTGQKSIDGLSRLALPRLISAVTIPMPPGFSPESRAPPRISLSLITLHLGPLARSRSSTPSGRVDGTPSSLPRGLSEINLNSGGFLVAPACRYQFQHPGWKSDGLHR